MQTNQPRRLPVLEMASNGVTNLAMQILQIVRFREHRFTQRAGGVSTIDSVLDQKYDLVQLDFHVRVKIKN